MYILFMVLFSNLFYSGVFTSAFEIDTNQYQMEKYVCIFFFFVNIMKLKYYVSFISHIKYQYNNIK